MRVLFRIIAAFLSAYVFVLFGSIFWHTSELWLITLGAWLISWMTVEIITSWRKKNSFPRLLTHLRYAPVAVFIFFLVTVIVYDEVMILHSRWMIRQYVYGSVLPETSPSLELHSSYRGWCGNGYTAAIYDDYADTAAEGFASSDPAVRARSLRASIDVYDGLNGVHDGPFPDLIERARNDPDPRVRKIAADFRAEIFFSDQRTATTLDCRNADKNDILSRIEFPKESEVKNFSLNSIEKDKAGFEIKVDWGSGVDHYEIQFNFRCKGNDFYLYRVKKVSFSTTNPDSGIFLDKKKTKITKIEPNLPIEKFVMTRYL
jgi:hypothetical protein